MSAPPPAAMPTAVMTTAPVSRLPKFTASSTRLTKPALTPKNSSNNTSAPTAAANANANANADMGQAASVNNGHSVSSTTSRLSNGFYHHSVITSGVKTSLVNGNGKQNGFIRTPTNFTAKWRKENVEDATADFEYKSGKNANCKKSPNNFTGKTRVLTPNAVSTPKVIPKSGNAKVTQKSTLNCLAKKQNGSSLPKSRSASPLEVKKQVAGRSHSSDSIGAAQNGTLTTRDKIRSRSLTQVQRQPSPTGTNPVGKSRAYSTNRAERKTGSATASMLPTAMVKKPLVPRQNGGGTFKIRAGIFKEPGPIRVKNEPKRNQRRNSVETPSDPGSSPEAPDSRGPSSEHGSQNEVSMLGETLEDMSLSSTSSLDHHDASQEYMDDFDNLGNGGVGMLLTSCAQNDDEDSGLDRSRFHDDEERVGVNGVSTATELCFLDDGLDWNHIRLAGDRDHPLRRLSRRRRSSQPDYNSQCGSSLDLSPSDSCGSGGTFLWDEEVEPLGGTVPIPAQPPVQASVQVSARINSGLQNGFHQNQVETKPGQDLTDSLHVGSLHSDISSIDVLNDLESCDLDDDDLMLDVDFPEEHSLTSDGGSHMAEWRRRQLCWGTTDSEFHTDKVSVEQQSKRKDSELSLDLCLTSLKKPSLGVDVEELVEDCSAVRSQLEYLQKLLLQEDDADEDTLTTDTLSPETDSSSDGTETQVEVLLQEVLQLREEVRSRDQTIAQLSQQLSAVAEVSSRCRCQNVDTAEVQTQTREKETESTGSQTPWNTPAILQPDQSRQDPLINNSSVQSGSPSDAPPSPLPSPSHTATAAAEEHGKRSPLPSKLRLFMFSGSSHFKPASSLSPASKRKPAQSPGSRVKSSPAPSCPSPSFSRLPKPKTH
ncbi:serine-rich coiled-coil domain-containing protein 2-like isoform X2 [Periophthalmus magnuspinnatus]|uniref:serine-rich coiled-coil domain-containing protein 2-like isoform X2 n=1 Tax=Periophthalmus magnuspinnatus TaxID=409849 RepID=UPI00145B9AA4|nr:serine-rich coiled-coil domain-containing protein 2-like isoform X2 [Periophthalmus magnuspinnatus]XP_055085546.1 serine-rich coiled-coil domain-containing protein 2-like isoform X2 [Periophthalmus magnuspinnatus]